MPLYMDVHTLDGPVTVDDVAKAHMADLQIQSKYDVRYLRYWVDEDAGKIFCLVESPSPDASTPCTARRTDSSPRRSTRSRRGHEDRCSRHSVRWPRPSWPSRSAAHPFDRHGPAGPGRPRRHGHRGRRPRSRRRAQQDRTRSTPRATPPASTIDWPAPGTRLRHAPRQGRHRVHRDARHGRDGRAPRQRRPRRHTRVRLRRPEALVYARGTGGGAWSRSSTSCCGRTGRRCTAGRPAAAPVRPEVRLHRQRQPVRPAAVLLTARLDLEAQPGRQVRAVQPEREVLPLLR